MMKAVLERQQVSPFTNGSADFRVTSSVATVALFCDAALTLLDPLIEVYEFRNTPRV
jgi:hypothetical protein